MDQIDDLTNVLVIVFISIISIELLICTGIFENIIDSIKDYHNREEIKEIKLLNRLKNIDDDISNMRCEKTNLDKIHSKTYLLIKKYGDIRYHQIYEEMKRNKVKSNKFYKNLATNRIEYIIQFLERCKEDKSLEDNADNILQTLQIAGDFFDSVLNQLDSMEKTIRDNKNTQIKEQMDKFNEITKSMNEGLKDVVAVETANKTL